MCSVLVFSPRHILASLPTFTPSLLDLYIPARLLVFLDPNSHQEAHPQAPQERGPSALVFLIMSVAPVALGFGKGSFILTQ